MTQRQPVRTRAQNSQGVTNWLIDPRVQGNAWAAAHGAGDAFTLGLADRVSSTIKALGDTRQGHDFRASYMRHMGAEQAQDKYEARQYGGARTAGQITGTVAQVGLLGAAELGVAGGVRVAEATPLLMREWAALGGAGGAGGVATQGLSDLSQRKLSSFGDYVGSATGGTVGALGSRFGLGSVAGAGAGATTSVAQDLANRRPISVDRAREAALTAAAAGSVAGRAGRSVSGKWNIDQKERAGELASLIRTAGRGQRTVSTKKTAYHLPGGGYTKPDQRVSGGGLVESKFGLDNSLSFRQRQAYRKLKDYRVDSTIPADVGALAAFPMAQMGFRGDDDSKTNWLFGSD